MRVRILYLIKYFVVWVIAFAIMKHLFMLYNADVATGIVLKDYVDVVIHAFSLDTATAGYLTAIPFLLTLLTIWLPFSFWTKVMTALNALFAFLIALIFVSDTCLYTFWGFKIDATIFNYIGSPKGAAASVSTSYILSAIIAILLVTALLYFLLHKVTPKVIKPTKHRLLTTLSVLIIGGVLFLFIRGGVGRSTSNVGQVYYSNNAFLNHAAVNPMFSLFYSMTKTKDFKDMGNFFPEEERLKLFNEARYDTTSVMVDTLLRTKRPNVMIILMESFAATFIEPLGGMPNVTPHFNEWSKKGVFFTKCYANSFRTDRATVCTFSGFPSFPMISLMKMPERTRNVSGIAKTLGRAGYTTSLLYGGDINFTNKQSYFRNTGYKNIVSDKDFTEAERKTHAWGVTDSITFEYVLGMMEQQDQSKPWHVMYQTLASHEPWTVPYHRFPEDEVVNSMAYVDECFGKFMDKVRQSPIWDNLLIICIADHSIPYPKGLSEAKLQHCHIPMLWLGGALKGSKEINTICNQTDLAATLLGQMNLPHGDFALSRDVTSATYTYPCAMHTWNNGLLFVDSTGHTAFDLTGNRIMADTPTPSERRLKIGKAILQSDYDYLDSLE